MSRCGYNDDIDQWPLIMWRGQVASAIRGKRGQAFLREMVEALDALPEKQLIAHDLQAGPSVCAIGSVGVRRGLDMSKLDPEDPDTIANTFGIAQQLVREVEFINDEALWGITPEERWRHVRAWAVSQIKPASGIEAATAVGTTQIGPTEGESPVPKADAQRPPQ